MAHINTFRQWCIDQHRKTNHFYDKIIPYEYHLNMVATEVKRHMLIGGKPYPGLSPIICTDILLDAAYGHDVIEDTRNTYNDVCTNGASNPVAEIIYALTDDKGKNRAERGNPGHYKKLVQIPGAAFVKFCDRIANIKYSKFSESSMYDAYKKENKAFIEKCYIKELCDYGLLNTLQGLFE